MMSPSHRAPSINRLTVGDVPIDLVFGRVRRINLSVRPPDGQVRISAPRRMSVEVVRLFALSKLAWIRKHQTRIRERERTAPTESADPWTRHVWGQVCVLTVVQGGSPAVEFQNGHLMVRVRRGSGARHLKKVLDEWYREQILAETLQLLEKWQPLMGVGIRQVRIRGMRTRWGSCTPTRRSIRLNIELGKRPRECLEYVVVHELVHLLEASHNARFAALMDRFMPEWRARRAELNRFPIGYLPQTPDVIGS
jgi:predicted metal-dependent hydrolase